MPNYQFHTLLQYVLPQHTVSRIIGWFSECRTPWIKHWMIHTFLDHYDVDMQAAVISDPDAYPTFNSFFTRALKPTARPIVQGKNEVACPVDGSVNQVGTIQEKRIFQAKGFEFNVAELLGGSEERARPFVDGEFATLYLAPKDYHRVHMPIAGQLLETVFIPGQLFSVNEQTTSNVPNLFARNERLACIFQTEHGPMAVILVGAMLVGSIRTVWETTQHSRSRKITVEHYPATGNRAVRLERGAELGHFRMGSTVILLFAKDKLNWSPTVQLNSSVCMGQLLATFS